MKNRMVVVWTAISCLAVAARLDAQDRNWVETRFHRVHLMNGNFVDGQLIQDSPKLLVLRIAGGEMSIRKDLVERNAQGALRIEFVKMRSYQEPPKLETIIDTKKSRSVPEASSSPASATASPTVAEAVDLTGSASDQLNQAREILKNGSAARKKGVVEALSRMGSEAAPLLAEALGSLEDEVLPAASSALQSMKEASVLSSIRPLLKSDRAAVREQAVLLLGAMGHDSKDAYSVRGMLHDSEGSVRGAALVAISQMSDFEAFDQVADLLSDQDPTVRSRALNVVIEFGDKGGLRDKAALTIGRLLEQTDGQTRLDIIKEASKLDSKELGPIFSRLALDSDPMVRSFAISGLARINSPEYAELILDRLPVEREYWPRVQLAGAAQVMRLDKSIDVLIDWLSDQDSNIRAAALRSLRGITRLNMGSEQEAWRDWREKTRQQK